MSLSYWLKYFEASKNQKAKVWRDELVFELTEIKYSKLFLYKLNLFLFENHGKN